MPVCLCGGGRAVCARVLVRVCWGRVCDPLRKQAGAVPSWAPSRNNWFHSFMPSFVNEHFFHERRVPGPSLGAGASLGPGTRPLLPWRNSQSREETDREKQKAIPSGKWIWWKRQWIWQKRCRWEFCPWPCDPAARAEILPLGPAGTVCFGGAGGGMEGEAGRRSREAPGTRRRTRRARGLREAAFPRPPRGTGWAGRGAGGARRELGWRAQRPPYGKRAAWLRPPEGACRGPGARHCLPLPGAARGAGAGRGRRCGGPSAGGPGEGRGRGAWLRSALQCGGGNRFQSVLLLAQRALLAPGSERSLSRLNPPPERSLPAGGLAGRGPERGSGEPLLGRCEAQAPQNPSPGAGVRVSWSLVSSPLTLAEVASLLILSFPARLRSPPPGSPLQKAGLGTSGAPTSSGVGDRLSNHAEPSGQGGWGHVSLHLPVGCCHPHCPRLCQARHPRLACCRTPWCLQPLPTPGSCPQLRQAWRESPGLGPMGRWQPTSVSGS